jgi:hypothetical protein
VAQLGKGLALDLADALPGEVEGVTDLFQGAGITPVQSVAQAEDLPLPGIEGPQELLDLLAEKASASSSGVGARPSSPSRLPRIRRRRRTWSPA